MVAVRAGGVGHGRAGGHGEESDHGASLLRDDCDGGALHEAADVERAVQATRGGPAGVGRSEGGSEVSAWALVEASARGAGRSAESRKRTVRPARAYLSTKDSIAATSDALAGRTAIVEAVMVLEDRRLASPTRGAPVSDARPFRKIDRDGTLRGMILPTNLALFLATAVSFSGRGFREGAPHRTRPGGEGAGAQSGSTASWRLFGRVHAKSTLPGAASRRGTDSRDPPHLLARPRFAPRLGTADTRPAPPAAAKRACSTCSPAPPPRAGPVASPRAPGTKTWCSWRG